MKRIGFTGTRHGMTDAQRQVVFALVRDMTPASEDWDQAHHGDCTGADADFHHIASSLGMYLVGHLPVDDTHRARCAFDETRSPTTHMARNRAIVAESDVMIACPYEATEQPRGGTWATIRMARKAGKPLAIVLPDGTVQRERWPNDAKPGSAP